MDKNLNIIAEAQPIVSQRDYPNPQSEKWNLKNESRFSEVTEQIFEVPPQYCESGTLGLKFGGAK